jgi:hypothetical protein
MAASREWTQWHLTPEGWVRGTTKLDFSQEDRPTPDDRQKTCEYREEMPSAYSRVEATVRTLWVGDPASVGELEQKFGSCPKHL